MLNTIIRCQVRYLPLPIDSRRSSVGFRFFRIKFRIITVMDMSDEVWHVVWSDNVTLHWLKGWEADPTANTTCQDDKEMRDHVVECGEGPSFRMAAHH